MKEAKEVKEEDIHGDMEPAEEDTNVRRIPLFSTSIVPQRQALQAHSVARDIGIDLESNGRSLKQLSPRISDNS